GDAELDGLPEERLRLVVGQGPPVGSLGGGVTVAHAAQRQPADLQPGVTEPGVLHLAISFAVRAWACAAGWLGPGSLPLIVARGLAGALASRRACRCRRTRPRCSSRLMALVTAAGEPRGVRPSCPWGA